MDKWFRMGVFWILLLLMMMLIHWLTVEFIVSFVAAGLATAAIETLWLDYKEKHPNKCKKKDKKK